MEFLANGNNIFNKRSLQSSSHTNDFYNKFEVISVDNKLDISASKHLKEEFSSKMLSRKNLIIDMSRCQYISNYGLCFLATIVNKAKLLNIKIVFIAVIDKISEIFDLTGFRKTTDFAPTFEAAVRGYTFH